MAEIGAIKPNQIAVLKRIGKHASSRFETVCNSYKLALHAIKEGLPGAFVECGVAWGSQVGAMGYACKQAGVRRDLWLYDSFKGIPMAGPKDTCQPGAGKIKHDVSLPLRQRLRGIGPGQNRSLPKVKAYLTAWGISLEWCTFVPGWFQDTVAVRQPKQIAILRLDGDLYESTAVCLKYLYPLVVKGGFVIVDDYALTGCRRAVHEYLGEKFDYNVVPTTSKVIWWRKK
jgi:O-methyltransferase